MIFFRNVYECNGIWNNNKQNGFGTQILVNNNKYEGEFKDGERDGRGVFFWPSGNKY